MSLKNLPVNANARLTESQRENNRKSIDLAFANKQNLFAQVQQREKDKIMEAYRKDVGYESIKSELDKVELKIEALKKLRDAGIKSLEDVGLDCGGDAQTQGYHDSTTGRYVNRPKAIKLAKLLDTLEKNAPSEMFKEKLKIRMNHATTVGEAEIIMKEIYGNDIIGNVDVKAITFEE